MPDNIILIVLDSLRYDHVGSRKGTFTLTPNIDRLGSEGIVFQQAIAQGPSTRVSMTAAMSSTYASMYDGQLQLSPNRPIVQSILRDHGYRTAGISANLYLSQGFGWSRGFDFFDDCRPESAYEKKPWMRAFNQVAKRVGLRLGWPKSMPAAYLFKRSREYLRIKSEPSFLWIHLMDTHWPYAIQRFSFAPSWHRKREFDNSMRPRLVSLPPQIEAAEHRNLIAEYRFAVSYLDREVGRFVTWLDRQGDLRDSWLFVTADHGEEFLDHGQYFHHPTLHDELVRVPLIIRPPSARQIQRGRVINRQVQLVDLAPTFLDIAQVPSERASWMAGRSLLPLIVEGKDSDSGYSIIESPGNKVLAVRGEGWKYIWHRDSGEKALFDLASDPGERKNVAPEEPTRLREMQSILDAHLESIASASPARKEPDKAPETDELVAQRLRDLGYVD